jgi:hypothetical protein
VSILLSFFYIAISSAASIIPDVNNIPFLNKNTEILPKHSISIDDCKIIDSSYDIQSNNIKLTLLIKNNTDSIFIINYENMLISFCNISQGGSFYGKHYIIPENRTHYITAYSQNTSYENIKIMNPSTVDYINIYFSATPQLIEDYFKIKNHKINWAFFLLTNKNLTLYKVLCGRGVDISNL